MSFVDLFNEILQAFALFVSAIFTLEVYNGISAGWLMVAISVMSIVIYFFFRRTQ